MRSDSLRRRTLLLLPLAAACEIEKVGIPATAARLSMHSVLSASAPTQVVLLERTRNGTVFPVAPPFDLGDPIVTDEGVAETGAFITLTTPTGETLIAREDNTVRDDRKGQGIYRFALPGSSLVRGGRYRIAVMTTQGESMAAETSVPEGAAAAVAEQRTFDRANDTLLLEWPASPGARRYFVRVETPYGPLQFFTGDTRVRLSGELRNVDRTSLPRVFVPGFPQAVTVSAVDSNYYDWYRSQNDALTGSGLVNRVQGGFGLFGSLVRLRYQDLSVVAPQTEPPAGVYNLIGTPEDFATAPFYQFTLYVESKAARSDQADALSGRFIRRVTFSPPFEPVDGILGSARNGEVTLNFIRLWSAKDTVEQFNGALRGDTLTGSYRGFGGLARFVRQRP